MCFYFENNDNQVSCNHILPYIYTGKKNKRNKSNLSTGRHVSPVVGDANRVARDVLDVGMNNVDVIPADVNASVPLVDEGAESTCARKRDKEDPVHHDAMMSTDTIDLTNSLDDPRKHDDADLDVLTPRIVECFAERKKHNEHNEKIMKGKDPWFNNSY